MNRKFMNLLSCKPQSTPPIWFMRQAGRYHSHYQNLRKKYSFEDLCKTPELAAEVACGPMIVFDYDVSILFSDILFPLELNSGASKIISYDCHSPGFLDALTRGMYCL